MGHQSYVLLCTETTLSNPPVVQPKSSGDVHLLRSPWISVVDIIISRHSIQIHFDFFIQPISENNKLMG